MDTDLRPLDHDGEPATADDDADGGELPNLRELEPDWEAADADVLDQHRDVPLDDER